MGVELKDTGLRTGPLMCVVSASGGVGKSTIALVAAWLASAAGIKTTLVEADLQFGDMGYWLGLDAELPNLGSGRSCEPINIAPCLSLYKAPPFPEVAEDVSDEVAELVSGVRRAYSLVIADTGQFWSGLTADLVVNADIVLNVMDRRPSSVMGAVRAAELVARMGVASSRCLAVYNRYSGKARLSEREVRTVLGIEELHSIGEGRAIVDALICAGALEELIDSGNQLVQGVDRLLGEVLPRVGLLYAGKGTGRRGGLRG